MSTFSEATVAILERITDLAPHSHPQGLHELSTAMLAVAQVVELVGRTKANPPNPN